MKSDPWCIKDPWWNYLPQCKVGDLVRYRHKNKLGLPRLGKEPWLVIEVKPKVPCRETPNQEVTVFSSLSGKTSSFEARNLEVLSESR